MESVKKLVQQRERMLGSSDRRLEDIFNTSYVQEEKVLAERNDGFRIFKTTYGQSKANIRRYAYSINKNYPDLKDQFIGLALDNCPEWIDIFWAVLASGNKPYLINHRYPRELTQKILARLDAKYLIGKKDMGYEGNLILIKDLNEVCPEDHIFNWADELAISTSATTLKEKIIFYSGKELSSQILNYNFIYDRNKIIASRDQGNVKLLAFLPLYHVFGLMVTFLWFTFFSCTMVFLRDYSSKIIIKTIKKHRVTHIFAVPLFWQSVEKEIWKQVDKQGPKTRKTVENALQFTAKMQKHGHNIQASRRLLRRITKSLFGPTVRFCISGGSFIKEDTLRLINGLGYFLVNGYGMTEIGITSVNLAKPFESRVKTTIGQPFPSVKYEIMEDGELVVTGASVAHKMLINGELIETNGTFKTNDIVKCENGNYYIVGRKDDLFIGENGENISPDDIEALVNVSCEKFSILNLNNKLTAIFQISKYISKNGLARLNEEVLTAFSSLDASMKPQQCFITYDNLMRPTEIKVSRKGVISRIDSGEIKLINPDEVSFKEELTANAEILNKVMQLMSETSGKAEIDPNAHFMLDLGCNSLDFYTLVYSINTTFGIDFKFDNDQNAYTAVGIAKRVEELL